MSLEHALLVSLSERPGTGIELTKRFDRSIGFFWRASHQQIYKVLRRMEADRWVSAGTGETRSTERRYTVTPAGRRELTRWIGSPTPATTLRSELAVKLRGASYGDRPRLLADLHRLIAEHSSRQAHFEQLQSTQFPDPAALSGQQLDTWLVLRGGIRQERFWVEWLGEYVAAWAPADPTGPTDPTDLPSSPTDEDRGHP